jgi:hypothetical protein
MKRLPIDPDFTIDSVLHFYSGTIFFIVIFKVMIHVIHFARGRTFGVGIIL